MSNKKLGGILLAVAVVLVVGFGVFKLTSKKAEAPAVQNQQQSVVGQEEKSNDTNKQQTQTADVVLTVAEVKKHNTESDCWAIISEKVYDITEYIPRHPGGDEILRACGNDATTLFTSRTTENGDSVGSGTPHSNSAESQLSQFLLGDLKI